MEYELHSFGAWVKRRRQALDLTPSDLADAVACSLVTIQKLERGRRRPSQQILARLADALAIDAAERPAFIRLGRAQRREGGAEQPHPPPAPLPTAGRLPRPLTPLVGREQELAVLVAMLRGSAQRLVTLTGPAGVGKTRLALEAAALCAEALPDGAAFIHLAHIADPAQFATSIYASLDETPPAGEPGDALSVLLRERSQLLVLDNFEQIIAAGPRLAALLQEAPGLRVLVTSRERLHLRGEQVYPVAPLEATPAVALFATLARAARPDFMLTEANSSRVARLCARLDGLPLALEIVAAHADIGSPELLERLDARLALTLDGPLDLPPRQRSLWAAFDWSYAGLDPEARWVFANLGVFANGWDDEAAAAITSAAARHLPALMRKHLVHRVDGPGGSRFMLLETVREFARERLGAAAEAARSRHADHYLSVAERGAEGLRGADQVAWVERLRLDQPNLEAALGWLLGAGHHERAARLAVALQRFWWMRGQLSEGRRWLERALAASEQIPLALVARLWHALGTAEVAQGDLECAEASLRRGLAVSQAAKDPYLIGLCAHALGVALADRQRYAEASQLLELGLRIDIDLGDTRGQAISLGTLGSLAYYQRDFTTAYAFFKESLALHRVVADQHSVALTLNNLAELARRTGDDAGAERCLEEALALAKQIDARRMIPYMLNNRALLLARQGRGDEARTALAEALALLRETDDRAELVTALLVGAQLRLGCGEAAAAARLIGAVDQLVASDALSLTPVTQDDRAGLVAWCARLLGDSEPDEQRRAGAAGGLAAAVELAVG